MKPVLLASLLLAACAAGDPVPSPSASGAPPADSVADWRSAFAAEGTLGTAVLYNVATGRTTRHDPERAAERFTPASTSKIWNGLVFLDRGVVADVDSVVAWDGVERWADAWNRDHSLRSGIEVSAVWLFQQLAREVGRDGYDAVYSRQPYGNATMGEPLDQAWLDGSLRISADEQVRFLDALLHDRLAFSAEDQATVREIVPVLAEAGGAALRGKTGWGRPDGEAEIGWVVGWVERPGTEPVVFAMNAEAAPGATFDVYEGRMRILRAVLADADVFPDGSDVRP